MSNSRYALTEPPRPLLEGRWIEVVPNFSEGRDWHTIGAIAEAARSSGALILDVHADADHNRSVVTLAAEPERVVDAVYAAVATAVGRIDLRRHSGVHPRIGAADVVPFVPLANVGMGECVKAAAALADRLASDLGLPVYLYEAAAEQRGHRNLADVRRKHAAAVRAGTALATDRGPREPHPSAGAVAVGARAPLVAFNCELGPDSLAAAKEIAAAIRERNGGLPGVKALAFWLEEAQSAQLSMNLVNLEETPPHAAVEHVESLAAALGASVVSSELVGLMPLKSVLRAAAAKLRLPELRVDQVLELRALQRQSTLTGFVADLASGSPAPGGGAASALAGSLAAALVSMVCNLTVGRRAYREHEAVLTSVRESAVELSLRLRQLMQDDEAAYHRVIRELKLDRQRQAEGLPPDEDREAALLAAAEVPLATARACLDVLRLAETAAQICNRNVVSDAATAALLAQAGGRAALLNVTVNARLMKDASSAERCLDERERLEQELGALGDLAFSAAESRL